MSSLVSGTARFGQAIKELMEYPLKDSVVFSLVGEPDCMVLGKDTHTWRLERETEGNVVKFNLFVIFDGLTLFPFEPVFVETWELVEIDEWGNPVVCKRLTAGAR